MIEIHLFQILNCMKVEGNITMARVGQCLSCDVSKDDMLLMTQKIWNLHFILGTCIDFDCRF
mgnify:FL=1